jgi:outer membrane receptor protein involved in Fe transport
MVGWRDRLFITAGVRGDRYSAFGSNLGLQTYPKISASYVISDETFWPKSAGSLKLRAAYGEAGRAPGAFDALRTYTPVGWGGQPAFRTNSVGNPDLGPERSRETEFGFDAVTLGDRLNLNASFYHTITTDALLPVSQIPSLGFLASQLQNVGKLKKQGLELEAFGDIVRSERLTWNTGLTVALNKSEVVSLGGAPAFMLGSASIKAAITSTRMRRTKHCRVACSGRAALARTRKILRSGLPGSAPTASLRTRVTTSSSSRPTSSRCET